jgi:hypothetical protein
MAIAFYSSGPVLVNYDSVDLGYTEDRVEITVQPFFDDIHTDSWGGLAGPFADRQLLGAVAAINCMLTKFDDAAVQKLSSFIDQAGTAGVVGSAKLGEFIYQDSMYAALDLKSTLTGSSLKFEFAHLSGAFSFNSSTRHRRYQLQFLTRMDDPCSRILYAAGTQGSCFDD